MNEWRTYFKGKKITMLGLGVLGRGVNVAKFLAERGAILTITDLKSKKELSSSLSSLKRYKNIRYVLGGHKLEDFRKCDMVIKAAGVPLDSPYIAEARKRGISVEMDASLFMKFSPATHIGVTGTRGKTTTAHLIAAILKQAGKKAYLGGNIRGMATLPLLKKIQKGDVVVLELDSWQLQGFGDSNMSPHIAVFTNFMPDHLNYYKGSLKKYFADKANIFKYQKKGDVLITNRELAKRVKKEFPKLDSKVVVPQPLPKNWKLGILGTHNRENAERARGVGKALGISETVVRKALGHFKGVPGRLELVREVRGVKYYNDTTATTPEATIAALRALDPKGEKNIVLMCGGADKGLDMKELIAEMPKRSKATVLLAGTGTDALIRKYYLLKDDQGPYNDLRAALQGAMSVAHSGDIVLFSPAFASFGLFKNEYDRGDQFNVLVKALRL